MVISKRQAVKTVAIIGAGPAGSAAATYLARGGVRVALFAGGARPELLVGESLVPAIVPILAELGVEDEVRGYSTFKPGATFYIEKGTEESFFFDIERPPLPTYAYNSPRDRFDQTILEAARKAGAQVFPHVARIEHEAGGDRIRLDDATLAATGGFLDGQPDFILDATGRTRLIARLLELSTRVGKRKDAALFAHLDDAVLRYPGHVHINRLDWGWSWRIPLPDRVSVGMVLPEERLPALGSTATEQYDTLLRVDAELAEFCDGRKRLSRVMRYSNYQLVADRFHGDGWALVGDAAGFVDPVFSSGLLLALKGGRAVARALLLGTDAALARYERQARDEIEAWHEVTDYFYDGRLFTLLHVGREFAKTLPGRLVNPFLSRRISRILMGTGTTVRLNRTVFNLLIRYALVGTDPAELRIR